MPPIRSESSQKLAHQEGRILLALADIQNGRVKSICAAAKLYEISHTTLADRVEDVLARVDSRPFRYKLTQLEEDSLTEWILSMNSRGASLKLATVGEMANILLAARSDHPPSTVGKNWPSPFIKRCDEL